MSVVTFTDLSKRFGGRGVLHSVSAAFHQGQIVALVGDNGVGKTTLLRIAAGVMRPSAGAVRVLGADPYRDRARTGARIGAVLEKPGHYTEQTVAQNLRFFYGFYVPASAVDAAVGAALDRFALHDVADVTVAELSLGFRHRVALARALHPRAEVLLLDEPFDSLDPQARMQLKTNLRAVAAAGGTVLLSSHNLEDVRELGATVLWLSAGGVRELPSIGHLRELVPVSADATLDEVYASLTRAEAGSC